MVQKKASEAGADQQTPSIPQYFSWINNTNEGSTEKQTLINLDFFAWLKKTYGMEIKIYAWDAGNFDGAGMGYGDADGEKFRTQYPNGYAPIVEKAAASGIRLGLWGSPDGFGDTPEEEKKRYDFMVDLCQKHHFALFKVDGVCGVLRPKKAGLYAQMLRDCRKYSPDLIVLNHRLNLYEAEKHVTTFLWQGAETYVDVHSGNHSTSMHHRGFIFQRGVPEDLERLAEDHGVCISSSVAYFEDDLIYQAFARCMILAPEIYGNPWLMRDDEYPRLARIFNLHKKCAPLLVDGLILPKSYGPSSVSRGTPSHKFLTTGNDTWEKRMIQISLDETIGLSKTTEKIALIHRHPSEKLIGIFHFAETVNVTLMPHRAHLFEIAVISEAYPVLENCEYEMICENEDGSPDKVKILYTDGGEITLLRGGIRTVFTSHNPVDIREFAPVYLGTMSDDNAMIQRGEELYETAQFGIDNDSLEMRELRKSGDTAIPEVQAARDAFFAQATYKGRGCDGQFAFDGNPDTYFDGYSRFYAGGLRIDGGCLRVDFGKIYDADTVEIVCFEADEPITEVPAQQYTENGSYSVNLSDWENTYGFEKIMLNEKHTAPVVKESIHNIFTINGKLVKVLYHLDKPAIRYFRLPLPMDRIYAIKLTKNGETLTLENPKVNNLQAMYGAKTVKAVKSAVLTLPKVNDDYYISVALEGIHGEEGAYCVAEIDGKLMSFPDRATAYKSNIWEHCVTSRDRNYTYYLPLTKTMTGKQITVYTMFCNKDKCDVRCDLYLCPKH